MKRKSVTLKTIIKKRIEERHNQNIYIIKRKDVKSTDYETLKKNEGSNMSSISSNIKNHIDNIGINVPKNKKTIMNDRTRLRAYGVVNNATPNTAPPPQPQVEIKHQRNNEIISKIKLGEYNKKIRVDFDAIFCVSSFNRYHKINRILKQIFTQETKYTFKFILLDDGSTDKKYEKLQYDYPDIIYVRNDIGGGKVGYWKTINQMWGIAKEFNTHGIIQLDDDFLLCKNFIDRLLDTFFEIKEINNQYMIVNFHLYNFSKVNPIESWWFDENEVFVDGGMLIDTQFMELINYKLDQIENRVNHKTSSFVWVRIKERLIEFGLKVYRTRNSLVWHDGNNDSKLHPTVRKLKRVYTKNYIDIDDVKNYEQ